MWRLQTVSYTHLDVYKRQVLEHQVKEIIGEQKVTGVVLEDAAVIDVNGVFVAYGAVRCV